ncbi:UNVERIFIED_CONTAM: hypothetical protein FKN15_020970 [Acipenser sinensis]
MNTRCPPKRVPSAVCFFTHCKLTMQTPRATASEDNAVLVSLQASPQAHGQTTGVTGARGDQGEQEETSQLAQEDMLSIVASWDAASFSSGMEVGG